MTQQTEWAAVVEFCEGYEPITFLTIGKTVVHGTERINLHNKMGVEAEFSVPFQLRGVHYELTLKRR